MKLLRNKLTKLNPILWTLLLASIFSCSETKEEVNTPTKEELANRKKNQIIDNNLEKLSKRYAVKYNLTRLTGDWEYSIDFDKVVNTNLQIIEGAIIEDIYHSGKDKIILQLKDRAIITDYFLTISEELHQKCITKYTDEGAEYFLVKLNKVKKNKASYPTSYYAFGDLIDVYNDTDILNFNY
jgi:hypothetical protein